MRKSLWQRMADEAANVAVAEGGGEVDLRGEERVLHEVEGGAGDLERLRGAGAG